MCPLSTHTCSCHGSRTNHDATRGIDVHDDHTKPPALVNVSTICVNGKGINHVLRNVMVNHNDALTKSSPTAGLIDPSHDGCAVLVNKTPTGEGIHVVTADMLSPVNTSFNRSTNHVLVTQKPVNG
jgi:hypothetical protein